MTFESLVGRAADRMAHLAHPPRASSPLETGGPVEAWARAAGVGCMPDDLLGAKPLPVGIHAPAVVARSALQRLAAIGIVETCPVGYRPVPRG